MTKIPNVVWPEQKGSYKFVQVDLDGFPYIRFGGNTNEGDRNYHATILGKFLIEHNIEYELMESRNGSKVPAPTGQRYAVQGMGLAIVDFDNKTAFFSGDSIDYGMYPNKDHLKKISEKEPDWEFSYY